MTKEERAALMPVTSELWRETVKEFGLPEWFRAQENGQQINYKKEPVMRKQSGVITLAALFLLTLIPLAWYELTPSNGRYQMAADAQGIVRMETATGGMERCNARLECKAQAPSQR